MSQQFERVPIDAGAVVREVRGFGGVPWGRLFRYLRPHWLDPVGEESSVREEAEPALL